MTTSTHQDAAAFAAAQADAPLHGFALEMLLPSAVSIRLLDGSVAPVTMNAHSFVGEDATYGTVELPETFSDGIAAEAPNITFALEVPSLAAAATLTAAANQGSTINLYYFVLNRSTGLIYGSAPYLVWTGAFDVATLVTDRNRRVVRIEAESFFGPFNDSFDGQLLTNQAHQDLWAAETGLEYVVDVQFNMPWGQDSPRPTLIRDVLGGGANRIGGGAATPDLGSWDGIALGAIGALR